MQILIFALVLLLGGTFAQWPCWQCPPYESGNKAASKHYGDICTECPARCNISCAIRCNESGHNGYADAGTCQQHCTQVCNGKCNLLAGEGKCNSTLQAARKAFLSHKVFLSKTHENTMSHENIMNHDDSIDVPEECDMECAAYYHDCFDWCAYVCCWDSPDPWCGQGCDSFFCADVYDVCGCNLCW